MSKKLHDKKMKGRYERKLEKIKKKFEMLE